MHTSETVTDGIRVAVEAVFDHERSRPHERQWFFLYTITITNEGSERAQLLTRHWKITDGDGNLEEVRGAGVVGEQPVLDPGESFEYTSGCPLTTAFGSMQGTYRMVRAADGQFFDVEIAPFLLSEQDMVH